MAEQNARGDDPSGVFCKSKCSVVVQNEQKIKIKIVYRYKKTKIGKKLLRKCERTVIIDAETKAPEHKSLTEIHLPAAMPLRFEYKIYLYHIKAQ